MSALILGLSFSFVTSEASQASPKPPKNSKGIVLKKTPPLSAAANPPASQPAKASLSFFPKLKNLNNLIQQKIPVETSDQTKIDQQKTLIEKQTEALTSDTSKETPLKNSLPGDQTSINKDQIIVANDKTELELGQTELTKDQTAETAATTKVKTITTQIQTLTSSISSSKKSVSAIEQEITTLNTQIAAINLKNPALSSTTLSNLQAKLKTQQNLLATTNKALTADQTTLKTLTPQATLLQENKATISKNLEALIAKTAANSPAVLAAQAALKSDDKAYDAFVQKLAAAYALQADQTNKEVAIAEAKETKVLNTPSTTNNADQIQANNLAISYGEQYDKSHNVSFYAAANTYLAAQDVLLKNTSPAPSNRFAFPVSTNPEDSAALQTLLNTNKNLVTNEMYQYKSNFNVVAYGNLGQGSPLKTYLQSQNTLLYNQFTMIQKTDLTLQNDQTSLNKLAQTQNKQLAAAQIKQTYTQNFANTTLSTAEQQYEAQISKDANVTPLKRAQTTLTNEDATLASAQQSAQTATTLAAENKSFLTANQASFSQDTAELKQNLHYISEDTAQVVRNTQWLNWAQQRHDPLNVPLASGITFNEEDSSKMQRATAGFEKEDTTLQAELASFHAHQTAYTQEEGIAQKENILLPSLQKEQNLDQAIVDQDRLNALNPKISSLTASITSAKNKVTTAESSIGSETTGISSLTQEIDQDKTLKQDQTTLSQDKASLQTNQDTLSQQTGQLAKLTTVFDHETLILNQYQSAVKTQNQTFLTSQATLQKAMGALAIAKQTDSTTSTDLNSLEAQVITLQNTVSQNQATLDTLQQTAEQHKDTLTTLQKQYTQLQNEIQKQVTLYNDQMAQATQFEQKWSAQGSISALNSYNDLVSQIQATNAHLQSLGGNTFPNLSPITENPIPQSYPTIHPKSSPVIPKLSPNPITPPSPPSPQPPPPENFEEEEPVEIIEPEENGEEEADEKGDEQDADLSERRQALSGGFMPMPGLAGMTGGQVVTGNTSSASPTSPGQK